MGLGWRSKYRLSSYSSDFELIICIKCILVLLARRDSGKLRSPATALNLFGFVITQLGMERKHYGHSEAVRPVDVMINGNITLTLKF